VKYEIEKVSLPFEMKTGARLTLMDGDMSVTGDVSYSGDGVIRVGAGGEYVLVARSRYLCRRRFRKSIVDTRLRSCH